MRRHRVDYDGVLRTDVVSTDAASLQTQITQPTRELILEDNKRRQIEEPTNDLSFGRWVLQIPVIDLANLVRKYPELQAPDRQIKRQAWARFMASDECRPYRVGKT